MSLSTRHAPYEPAPPLVGLEIIADNLSKAGWELGLRVSFGLRGAKRSGLSMHTAMGIVSLCGRMKG